MCVVLIAFVLVEFVDKPESVDAFREAVLRQAENPTRP